VITELHHGPRVKLLAGLAEGRCTDAMAAQPLGKKVNEFIKLVLDGAFAQVQQQRHQGGQRQGAFTGEVGRSNQRTRSEATGKQILFQRSIDIFKFKKSIVVQNQKVALTSALGPWRKIFVIVI
jgi:hypothetical protein